MADGQELYNQAFDELPAYPEQLQTKSVLMKRMGEIKSSTGFTSKGEGAKTKDVTAGYKTAVSAALSKNAGKAQAESLPDLLGETEPTESSSTGDLIGLGEDFGSSPPAAELTHSLKTANAADFSPVQTVNFEAEQEDFISPHPQFKKMLPVNSKDGIVFEDDSIEVKAKLNFKKYDGKIILELHSKGASIVDIKTSTKIPETLKMMVSDVQYPEAAAPRVMVRVFQLRPAATPPKIAFRYQQNGEVKTINFSLPILANKFIEGVDMTPEKFVTVWTDITGNRPDTFEKLDLVLKNPAPAHVPVEDVLKKIANLLTNCLGLKVLAPHGSDFN